MVLRAGSGEQLFQISRPALVPTLKVLGQTGLVQPRTPGQERGRRGSGLRKKPSPPAALEEVGNHYPEESVAVSEPRKQFNLFN